MAEIETQKASYHGKNRRKESRKRYKKTLRIIVRVSHPGGSDMTFAVRTRDISARGIGFMHGSFLYPDTPCKLILPTLDKQMIALPGKIVRCRLVSGKLHEVGVEFAETIDVAMFIDDMVDAEEPAPAG